MRIPSHGTGSEVTAMTHTIVGLGEILWDLFPAGRQMGGAPANFAYITSLLGNRGIAASRLGYDDLGRAAIDRVRELGLDVAFLQRDPQHPTGTVHVKVDENGQPCFEILQSVAWDYLEWTVQWQSLAAQADADMLRIAGAAGSAEPRHHPEFSCKRHGRNAFACST
jgi:sugar/nucleoside kinase (ribokinase family)